MHLFFILFSFFRSIIGTDPGYDIQIKLKHAPSDTLYLGYYYADKQFLRDTAVGKDGLFKFKNTKSLEPGIYLLVMPPKNDFIQLFINEGEQQLQIEADAQEVVKSFRIKGSHDNEVFYDYLNYLDIKRPEAQVLTEQIKATADDKIKAGLQEKLDDLNKAVKDKQKNIVAQNAGSLSALLVESTLEVEMPSFEGTKSEVDMQRYLYYKTHYFDHLPIGDQRVLRSPLLHDRLEYYVEKLTPQEPDSINVALDYIFKKIKNSEETFKYYLIHFLNKYAGSKLVGFDAIYVHLVDEYYSKGFASWIDEEQLQKMEKNAAALRPILIGKIAPEIKLIQYPNEKPISLHQINSPYTILFIWDPTCSHCKASMPFVVKFYEKFKSHGVELLAVCSQFTDKVPTCWQYLDEQKIKPGWINAADPYHASKYKVLYDVKSTPQIFILDQDKKILSKGIGAEQLDEVMTHIIEVMSHK
ncbi:MAG: redoxin domain-containing protein [Saprospiraceae bacterium]|nr:redoxin domain-containing protein [Saprospiraceae bacterium]